MEIIFTNHAKERLEERGILEEDIKDTVQNPSTVQKKHGKYYAQKKFPRGTLEVIFEKTEMYIKIITAYWN